MDLSEMTPDGEANAGKGAPFTCTGTVASVLVNGEANIMVSKDGFTLTSTLDATRVTWAEVVKIQCEDYVVHVNTKSSKYDLFKLGYDTDPLYAHMLSAYGDKVRKALFVKGSPLVRAKGNVGAVQGVPIEIYDDCILSLPPDLSARRVPLSFVTGFKDDGFTISVSTMDGKETVYSKLGYEHDPASRAIQDAVKAQREKTIDQVTELAPQINAEQASRLARCLPEGMAAPIGVVRGISPSLADALEGKIAKSRAAETYKAFRGISGEEAICIGFKKNDMAPFGEADAANPEAAAQFPGNGAEDGGQEADPYMLWLIAPTPGKNACAVEFAGAADASAATFVYKFSGAWDDFRVKLGMALEAIAFKREIIRLSDAELEKNENADYRMANDRNEAVRFVRACFVGRAIHRSMDSWKSQVEDLLSD